MNRAVLKVCGSIALHEMATLEGLRGKGYNGACPTDLDPAFRYAMQEGRKVYTLEREVQQQKRELKKAYKDLDALEMELSDKEAELIKPPRQHLLAEYICWKN